MFALIFRPGNKKTFVKTGVICTKKLYVSVKYRGGNNLIYIKYVKTLKVYASFLSMLISQLIKKLYKLNIAFLNLYENVRQHL